LRAAHRDVGYLLVGLTLVYALSGLAVNHIGEWDPNHRAVERIFALEAPVTGSPTEAAARALAAAGIDAAPDDVFATGDDEVHILAGERTLTVHRPSGRVHEQGREPRFFLRAANWLHLNRGKRAWTYVADGYAILLVLLALSGLFMLPGPKGLIGRGALIALVGAAVPILYVALSAP
jgi:hypothetical protein